MERRDAVIVGGGPAGSTAAWKLKQAGLNVLVLDRAVFPRDKVCAGWITPPVIDSLELDLDDYRKTRVFQAVTGFLISFMKGSPVGIDYRERVSYGIRRIEFDNYLLHRSGAELVLGEPLQTLRRDKESWLINDKWETPLLIGAGGHHCPVARFLAGERPTHPPVVVAQEAEFMIEQALEKEYAVQPQSPELYFCEDLKGYGWCIRKGGYLNVGLGREDPEDFSRHISEFILALKRLKRIPANADYRLKGHSYLLNLHSPRPLTGDGVILIGDSAGLAYSESGEGIRPAVESALIAVNTVLRSGGSFSRSSLASYDAEIVRRFGSRGVRSDREAGWLKTVVAKYLVPRKWFAEKILLDRWFLRRKQSPLVFKNPLFN